MVTNDESSTRAVRSAMACAVSVVLAACGAGDGGDAGADHPMGQAAVGSTSSTHPGNSRATGLVAKRLGALECGARVQTRHTDHRAAFGTSVRARMQMPDDCTPGASARLTAKVPEDLD